MDGHICLKFVCLILLNCLSASKSTETGLYEVNGTPLVDTSVSGFFQCSPMQCPNNGASKRNRTGISSGAATESHILSLNVKDNKNRNSDDESTKPKEVGGGSSARVETQNEDNKFSCKDGNGYKVDWFIAIKKDNSNKFVYVTNLNVENWIDRKNIKGLDSPITQTLNQGFNRNEESVFFNYNYPDQTRKMHHMKGVILVGNKKQDDTGFWMTHSVPNFPNFDANNGNIWSMVTDERGQSFFCATFKKDQLEKIIDNLVKLFNEIDYQIKPLEIKTDGNVDIKVYLKYPKNNKDIYGYDELNLKEFQVQSYRLGASLPLPNSDKVKNVLFTKFTDEFGFMSFARDNSKWGICVHQRDDTKWICIGDLDRVEAHKTRGGTLICMMNEHVWSLFYNAIKQGNAAAVRDEDQQPRQQQHQQQHQQRQQQQDQPHQYQQPQQYQQQQQLRQLQQQQQQQQAEDNEFSCKISENLKVDWFVMVKEHEIIKKKLRVQGLNYKYLSSLNSAEWQLGDDITNNGPLKETLQPSVFTNQRLTKIAYNNQPPPNMNDKTKNAHAKGVVVLDETSGFWLMHSVPKFPDFSKTEYSYPGNGVAMGQIFLCLCFKPEEKDNILKQLKVMNPHVYYGDSHLVNIPNEGEIRMTALYSLNGVEFLHISRKSFELINENIKDIYEIVSRLLGSKLYCQTWSAGRGTPMTSRDITRIIETSYPNSNFMKSGSDHSKWCITQDVTIPYFCIGDLNRKEPKRLMRGGGVLCVRNKNIWIKFRDVIYTV